MSGSWSGGPGCSELFPGDRRTAGLCPPLVYNTGGYDSPEAVGLLDGGHRHLYVGEEFREALVLAGRYGLCLDNRCGARFARA